MEWGNKIEWLHGTNKSRGLAILLKNNLNYNLIKTYQDPHGRFLFLEIKVKNSCLTIANIYGPNVDDFDFFRYMFVKLNDFSKIEILLGGDFNVILNNDLDKLNGSPHKNKLARQKILNYMKSLNLIDAYRELHPDVKKFTRLQINPLIASRLDYFLVSKSLYFQVKECDIVPSLKSDHKIVTLLVHHNSSPRGRGYWKFNNNLLLNDEYISKTKIVIADYLLNNTATETNPHTRWEALKCFLRGHAINYSCRKKKNVVYETRRT